jgi:hypothetical protein
MNGRRREQFEGLYPGPYTIGEATKADIPVLAQGPEGPVVVGRFPITKVMDGEAQATAYAALPDLLAALKAVHLAKHPDVFLRELVWDALEKAGL